MSVARDNMAEKTYAEYVTQVLGEWLASKSHETLCELVRVLGCPYMGLSTHLYAPVTASDENVVKAIWPVLFQEWQPMHDLPHAAQRSVVMGLLKKDRWHSMMSSVGTAHIFAGLVITCVWFAKEYQHVLLDKWEQEKDRELSAQLRTALGDWVAGPRPKSITTRSIAEAFFGKDWCFMVYDNLAYKGEVHEVVRGQRPPFLEGRLNDGADSSPATLELPDLGRS